MIADNVFQETQQVAGYVLTSQGPNVPPKFVAPPAGCTVLSGSTDALPKFGLFFVTTAGVDAMTLPTPVAGTDDGVALEVIDAGGHAHTITTAANKITPSHDTLTFNGTAGSYVRLKAYNGFWYIVGSTGVAATEV